MLVKELVLREGSAQLRRFDDQVDLIEMAGEEREREVLFSLLGEELWYIKL